ncbi:hypothetical protein NMD1_00133 [Novosphingobium sp. MD-1]|nr:hypothetical protein NMD1_00133 [Novosphingobium sp. MD-1]
MRSILSCAFVQFVGRLSAGRAVMTKACVIDCIIRRKV